ncbi:hypothetical protein Dsin_024918 [Dipteronia sinensis]|uniref:Uncharacterized protein n=1 Tax=Dipteronia sinensis TaxID=43782 RepID=A0AAE0DWM0_9ROSI|nr:hypothetical protein Dsin_024918 [Dipteronia sinensis]
MNLISTHFDPSFLNSTFFLQENRMGEEVDLLEKVSKHFLTKINSTSSMVATKLWQSRIALW